MPVIGLLCKLPGNFPGFSVFSGIKGNLFSSAQLLAFFICKTVSAPDSCERDVASIELPFVFFLYWSSGNLAKFLSVLLHHFPIINDHLPDFFEAVFGVFLSRRHFPHFFLQHLCDLQISDMGSGKKGVTHLSIGAH